MRKARIRLVLVDDDHDNLEAFSIALGEMCDVFAYASAVEALQGLARAKPDVLLLDIGMGPVDGIRCLQMIRATPGYRDIPAVALTGFARDVDRRRFHGAGFEVVVVKPVLELEDLMAAIEALVHSSGPAEPGLAQTRA